MIGRRRTAGRRVLAPVAHNPRPVPEMAARTRPKTSSGRAEGGITRRTTAAARCRAGRAEAAGEATAVVGSRHQAPGRSGMVPPRAKRPAGHSAVPKSRQGGQFYCRPAPGRARLRPSRGKPQRQGPRSGIAADEAHRDRGFTQAAGRGRACHQAAAGRIVRPAAARGRVSRQEPVSVRVRRQAADLGRVCRLPPGRARLRPSRGKPLRQDRTRRQARPVEKGSPRRAIRQSCRVPGLTAPPTAE